MSYLVNLPNIPNKTDFWQEVWDKRSLNQTLDRGCPLKKQNKQKNKQKEDHADNKRRRLDKDGNKTSYEDAQQLASKPLLSTSTLLCDTFHASTTEPSVPPPVSFCAAFQMLQTAWHSSYSHLPFPIKHIALFPTDKANEILKFLIADLQEDSP